MVLISLVPQTIEIVLMAAVVLMTAFLLSAHAQSKK